MSRGVASIAFAVIAAACEGAAVSSADAGTPRAPEDELAQPDAETPRTYEVVLFDQSDWRPYAPELDPLPSHQPAAVACDPPGWLLELERLEVDTSRCNYLLLEHPAQAAIPRGSEVSLDLWHFDLTAAEPANAHVALFFGSELQWETTIAIPQPGNLHEIRFAATRALSPGDPVRLHLHNHGGNTWLLSRPTARVRE